MNSAAKICALGIVVLIASAIPLVSSAVSPGISEDGQQPILGYPVEVAKSEAAPETPSAPIGLGQGGRFMQNLGQLNRADIQLYVSLGRLQVGFVPDGLLLDLREPLVAPLHDELGVRFEAGHISELAPQPGGVMLGLTYEGANRVVPVGRGRLPNPTHFFLGDDLTQWRTNVPSYSEVVYENLYEGIDLVYRLEGSRLKYEFHVRPGADPSLIRWSVEGAESTAIDAGGNMVLATAAGDFVDDAPFVFQESGPLSAIPSRYALLEAGMVGFSIGEYEASRPLIIDPGLDFSTFVGGSLADVCIALVADSTGTTTVTGYTYSTGFPTTLGAYDIVHNDNADVFVFRLAPSGKSLVYSTFVGGPLDEVPYDIALDDGGNVTVTGYTTSVNFPTTPGAYDIAHNGGVDAFVFRLNKTGARLVYSTFVGGSGADYGRAVAVDPAGTATVAGHTDSATFPTTPGGFDTVYNGGTDVFVLQLNAAGTGLLYSTFVGGADPDLGIALALDPAGMATVTGQTYSGNFPTTVGAFDTSWGGNYDAFISRLDASGGSLQYSTFLGGFGEDYGLALALDAAGKATVTGYTNSGNFPTTPGAFDTSLSGAYDTFVLRLEASGSSLAYGTFVGGSGSDFGYALALDAAGSATVTGYSNDGDFPTTPGALDRVYNGGLYDAFLFRLHPSGSSLPYSTFIGGSSDDFGRGVAMYAPTVLIVAGSTSSANFPTTPGAYDTGANGQSDVFVLRLKASVEPVASNLGVQGHTASPAILHITDFTPDLNWTYTDPAGDPQLQYEVRVGTRSGGSEMWAPGPQVGSETTVTYAGMPLSRGMDYYFGVRVFSGNEWSAWTEIAFRINQLPNPPTTPVSPAEGATIPANPMQTLWWTSDGDPDEDSLSFDWQVASDPGFATILSSGRTSSPTSAPFSSSPSTTYHWRVQAWDGYEFSAYGNEPNGRWTFTTDAPNLPPIADAGPDQTVRKQTLVALDGSASIDPDGDPLSFTWTPPAGISLSATDVASPTFTPSRAGIYPILLSVGDGRGGTAADGVIITVTNGAPDAQAGADQSVQKSSLVTLDGRASSDPDGDPLSYQWQQVGGPAVTLFGATTSTATFSATMSGAFLFTLTANDGDGGSDIDSVLVTVGNRGPTASAGPDQSVTKNALVTLDGRASSDPDGDPLSFRWEQLSGPAVTLFGATTSTATFTPTRSGTYVFSLSVVDDDEGSDTDALVVAVQDRPPTAAAGSDHDVLKKGVVTLSGSASSDPDGDALSFAWRQIGGPSVGLSDATTATPTFIPTSSGMYAFVLTVTDGDGGSDTDSVVVAVRNRAPVADAGLDQSAGKNILVTLDGRGSFDPDDDLLSYQWRQVSGPSVTLAGASTAATTFTPTVSGAYAFALSVDDGDGGTMTDYVTAIATNRQPTADAGPDQIVSSGTPFGLSGSGSSDPDGDSLAFAWQQVSGPVVAISGADQAVASVTPTKSGSYVFQLTVSDGDGGMAADLVQVHVQNTAPIAMAGTDVIVRKNALVTLDGTASTDPNSDALQYSWQQIGGPPVTLTGAEGVTATFTPSTSGAYAFTLTVDDGDGGVDRDFVVITVQNRNPTANAGSAQSGEPGASFSIDGGASHDLDGDPLSYAWTQEGGPSVSLTGENTASAGFTAQEVGTYLFRLTVTDEEGTSDADTVLVHVKAKEVVRVQGPFPVEIPLVVLVIVLGVLLLLSLRSRRRGKEDAVVGDTSPRREGPPEE